MRGPAFVVSMAMAVAGCALGQNAKPADPLECSRVVERLRSTSYREKAWGAHFAVACQTPDIARELTAQLSRMNSGRTAEGESEWAGPAMLDALIQLHQPLEASSLTALAKRFPTEATILMLQDASRNRSLLAAIREEPVSYSIWVAASNALARLRAPGFAAALLREVSLTTQVIVLDPGGVPRGTAGSGLTGHSNMQLPPGFPPVAIYWLTAEREAGEELAGDGPTPIYSRRTVIDPGVTRSVTCPWDATPIHCPDECQEYKSQRSRYLAGLAELPGSDVHRIIQHDLILEWSTPEQIDAAISRAQAEQEAGIRHLVRSLVSTGALQNSELGITFRIKVLMDDQRSDRSVPLRQHPALEFRVE